jgi:dTDP-4-amino-4,6-dideoxygalactose transaminase
MNAHFEVPPTAGLPPQWRDLLPGGTALAENIGHLFTLSAPQLECSGTAALIVTLHTLAQTSSRKNVILPAYTCPLVALAVAHCGLNIKLCDLLPEHFDLDPEHLARLVDDNTLAIVPTHLGGRVADIDGIARLAREHGAYIIEDAAQALGAQQQGISVGLKGDAAFFSLAVGKGLTTYEGGVLISRDADLREKLKNTGQKIIPHSARWEIQRSIELLGYTAFYQPRSLHYVYGQPLRRALAQGDWVGAVGDDFDTNIPLHRMGSWRKMVGTHALTRLPEFLIATREQALARVQRLQSISSMTILTDSAHQQGVWPFIMVVMKNEAARNAALGRLWRSGLGVSRLFIHALPDYRYLQNIVPAGDIPHARDFAARMLTISNSLWLDDVGFERICAVLEASARSSR